MLREILRKIVICLIISPTRTNYDWVPGKNGHLGLSSVRTQKNSSRSLLCRLLSELCLLMSCLVLSWLQGNIKEIDQVILNLISPLVAPVCNDAIKMILWLFFLYLSFFIRHLGLATWLHHNFYAHIACIHNCSSVFWVEINYLLFLTHKVSSSPLDACSAFLCRKKLTSK